jgi:hypothetical protein
MTYELPAWFNNLKKQIIKQNIGDGTRFTKCSDCENIMVGQPAAMRLSDSVPEYLCEECAPSLF